MGRAELASAVDWVTATVAVPRVRAAATAAARAVLRVIRFLPPSRGCWGKPVRREDARGGRGDGSIRRTNSRIRRNRGGRPAGLRRGGERGGAID
ncbi:hypothetical protein GCM10023235_07860 [Kitasatospora terrestris]|uniref:Uncharacterized protein n=1 Tax=Kitasatospora terrestris TaxID=258051 RepID=A0ABP9D956_9ACTN